jgi:hypothetical protein
VDRLQGFTHIRSEKMRPERPMIHTGHNEGFCIDLIEGRSSVLSPALLEMQLIVRDSCCPPRNTVTTSHGGRENGRERS